MNSDFPKVDSVRQRSALRVEVLSILGIALILLALVGLVFAETDKPSDTLPSRGSHAMMPSDSVTPNWDSIYAVIQDGFVRLKPIFQRACFDCHSDQTHYPWYHALPGIKQLLDKDIREARKRLDMSGGFPFGKRARPADDLSRIREEVADGGMPLWSYRLMHWNANPSDSERDSIIKWIDQSLRMMAAHGQYPFGQPSEAPETDQGEEETESTE